MIKVAARNKFSRKTSIPSQPQQPNLLRKTNRNRSSILVNGQTYQQYFEFLQTEEILQNTLVTRNTPFHEKNTNQKKNNQSNFIPKSKIRKTLSIKPLEQSLEQDKKSCTNSNKFSKLGSGEFSRIKNQEKNEKNNQENMKLSKKQSINESMRSSAMKKFGNRFQKTEIPFTRTSKIKKASIFQKTHLHFGQQSQHYEDFLKESDLHELTKRKIDVKQTEKIQQKQNEDEDEVKKKSNFFIEDETNPKQKEQNLKTNKYKRTSSKLIESNTSKTRKISQNELQLPKDYHPTYKQIFHSLNQKNFEEKNDQKNIKFTQSLEESQNQQTNKQITLNNQQELKKAQQKRIQQQRLYKQQTEELFRKLERQIASKMELERFQKKSKNYYEQLRLKLIKQYDQISKDYRLQEKEKDKIGLLIQGCNLQRHRRVTNFCFQKKMFSDLARPETAGAIDQASKDINKLNFANKQRNKTILRPQTSRPKSSSKTRGKISYGKSSHMFSDYITNMTGLHTERDFNQSINKTFNKLSDEGSEYIFCMTNPDLKSQAKLRCITSKRSSKDISKDPMNYIGLSYANKASRQALSKQRKNLTTKFENLLGICDDQNEQHEDTKKKMKAFQYYCTKIDNGFEKLSQRIQDYVLKL